MQRGAAALIERDIQVLERFAGRGDYPGAAFGPPAVVRISATDSSGVESRCCRVTYQWSQQHLNAPLFRISNIAWDAGALRLDNGNRVRQTATVTATQYTPIHFVIRSVAQRTATIPSRTSKQR